MPSSSVGSVGEPVGLAAHRFHLVPARPVAVRAAARALRYREHIGVNLLVEGRPFPDNWIYVHSADVALARQHVVGWIEPDPTTSRNKRFNPGMCSI